MSQAALQQFYLAWKGAHLGPFTLDEIQEKLVAGEISRMHQVQVDGRWMPVDELLVRREAAQRQAVHAREAQARTREAQLRSEFAARLAAERAQHDSLAEQLEAAERRARFLPPDAHTPAPPPPPKPEYLPRPVQPSLGELPPPSPEKSRTSGFAIAALICAICNFIPFLNFVSWVLALVFGHVALRDINHDSSLAGRGLALAALFITYFLLVLGLTFGVLLVANGPLRW